MRLLTLLILSMLAFQSEAQQTQPMRLLYQNNEIPGALKDSSALSDQETPKLYPYVLPEPEKELVFLVIPGGGYCGVAMAHEGHDVAARLNQVGYSAYVLYYRLPSVQTMKDKRFGPLQDAQVALSRIRELHAGKKIVVIGFSAGGHLAASLSNHYDRPQTTFLKGYNLRPDVSVLCYPVISMDDEITHKGSKSNLIGPDPAANDVALFSLELQVDKNTPPTFLMSAKDDQAVPIENSYRYQQALQKNGVTTTLFTYEKGGHGFGLINSTDNRDWFAAMIQWIETVEDGGKAAI